MFRSGTKEALDGAMKIHEMEPTVVAELLHFIYTGKASVLEKNKNKKFIIYYMYKKYKYFL
jgi:hypothetical protein